MKASPDKLNPLTSPWPFAKWGVDVVGSMSVGKGGRKFLVVVVDYFTKWAEAEALAAITTTNITSFLWKSVVCRFGIPHAFVTDNGKQFDYEPFRKWCSKLRIRNYYASVLYPKANGQVEATNKTLVKTLKKKLDKKKGAWVEYVPEVLWSYRTTRRTPTGETPFSLTYGAEAVIPVEVGSPSFRVAYYNPGLNDEKAKVYLDLLQEKRDDAQVTWAAYQNRTARYFNKQVVPRKFQLRDWVLRKVSLMTKDPTEGKMGPKWEGPYKVVGCHQKGAYRLMTETGKILPRSWNAEHLKKYYM
jgi:transposase InsO family protein